MNFFVSRMNKKRSKKKDLTGYLITQGAAFILITKYSSTVQSLGMKSNPVCPPFGAAQSVDLVTVQRIDNSLLDNPTKPIVESRTQSQHNRRFDRRGRPHCARLCHWKRI